MMKKIIVITFFILLYSGDLFSADTFFGTSISIFTNYSSMNDQSALFINAKWDLNISKIFEIGVVYSKLLSNVNADFIDNTAKTEPLIFLNYGGLDLGFYPYYDDDYSIRTGITLAGGGYKYIAKDNIKFDSYGDINIGVYEPQIEFGYFFAQSWQLAFDLTYRYIDIDNIKFSSFGAGLGVKYGIFK